MGDSADTAREKQSAKKVPKRKKPSPDARIFGAHTAIFVPPELQHESGPKPKPVPRGSVVIKVPKRTESLPEKRTRLAAETNARERMRIGRKIHTATGRNVTDAVPDYHPPPSRRIHPLGGLLSVPRFIPGTHTEWSDVAHGTEGVAKAISGSGALSFLNPNPGRLDPRRGRGEVSPSDEFGPAITAAKGVAKAGGEMLDPFAHFLIPNPAGLNPRRTGARDLHTAADLKKHFESMSDQVVGKSITNLITEGDAPNSKMQAAGLGLGVLGILPIGRITQFAKLGRGLSEAGKIGEALPMTPEREAAFKAMAQRVGEEQAADAMLLYDAAARIKYPDNPNLLYEEVPVHATRHADFAPTAGTRYQTEAGPRSGLVEGRRVTAKRLVGKRASFKHVNADEENLIHFDTAEGDPAMLEKMGPGEFQITVLEDPDTGRWEEYTLDMDAARKVLKEGSGHYVNDEVAPTEVPVFRADIPAEVAKLPTKTVMLEGEPTEVYSHSKSQIESSIRNAVKPSDWEDSGLKAFFDEYGPDDPIPTDDLNYHLATALNAYDVDEVIYRSDSGATVLSRYTSPSPTMWQDYAEGGLIVRDPTPDSPYIELFMNLRAPLRTRMRRGVFGDKPFPSSYVGKGDVHWRTDDVIGHVRMHIIIDADGKKALLVDEIQSDWASQWNSLKKYANMQPKNDKTVMQRAEDQIEKMRDQWEKMDEDRAVAEQQRAHDDVVELEDQMRVLGQHIEDLDHLMADVPGPPPLGTKQMEAIVRRTLRFAQESGVERIIIVQGDVQAVRNQAFLVTPKGRKIQIHDNPDWQNDLQKWREDTHGMSQAEIKAFANNPAHLEGDHKSGMVETFKRLYGQGEQGGTVQGIFEKEMGEKGAVKKGIFEGGYADEGKAISRKRPQDDMVIDGVQYMEDPSFPEPKVGDIVQTVEGPGKVHGTYSNAEITIELNVGRMVTKPRHYVHVIIPDPDAGPVLPFTQMMDGYVIEMTEGAKTKAAAPMAYYQQRAWEKIPKGATEFFNDKAVAIHLFEDADISTIIHELSHVVLPDLNPVDRAILNRHYGNFATTADHEAYARALERYVYEGAAMKSDLDGVLGRIKNWMGQVYLHVNNIGAHLHPEVKQVFDRMLVKAESPEQQLVRMLKEAPPVRRAQEAGYSEERGKRIADMFEQWDREGGKDSFHAAIGALKGELPKEEFTALDDLSPEAVDHIVNAIRNSNRVRPYQKVRAAAAVVKATEGAVPTRSELALLEKIFGKEVGFKKVRKNGIDQILVEIINIPRSLSASLDLSAPLRQGLVAGARHPIIFKRNFVPMIKALKVKNYEDQTEQIVLRPNFERYQRAKLAVETNASDPAFANREEAFYSSYADKIPGVKHSSNAYSSFLHNMRADVFDHMIATAEKKGIDVDRDEFLRGLGMYVNSITGRGALPNTELLPIEKMAPGLNTLFFSPRLLASRINMISPFYYGKLWRQDPFVAKQAMRAMVHTVAGAVATLAIADQMPGVDVGLNPTSANFGKVRIGDTRIDILAGFNPLMVFIVREALGKSTSSTTGKTQDLKGGFGKSTRKDILYRFGESKLAPSAGILRDVLGGQTFIGQELTTDWHSVGVEALNFIPMMWRDAWEVGHESNDPTVGAAAAAAVAVLGGLGVGFSSYPDKKPKASGGGSEPKGGAPEGWGDGGSGGGAPEGWDDGGTGGGLPEGW